VEFQGLIVISPKVIVIWAAAALAEGLTAQRAQFANNNYEPRCKWCAGKFTLESSCDHEYLMARAVFDAYGVWK